MRGWFVRLSATTIGLVATGSTAGTGWSSVQVQIAELANPHVLRSDKTNPTRNIFHHCNITPLLPTSFRHDCGIEACSLGLTTHLVSRLEMCYYYHYYYQFQCYLLFMLSSLSLLSFLILLLLLLLLSYHYKPWLCSSFLIRKSYLSSRCFCRCYMSDAAFAD